MKYLPIISEEEVAREFEILVSTIKDGDLKSWLNMELEEIKANNPSLYTFLITRAKTFAGGITKLIGGDFEAIVISITLEYLMFLKVIDSSLGKQFTEKKFGDMMGKWFPNGLKGTE